MVSCCLSCLTLTSPLPHFLSHPLSLYFSPILSPCRSLPSSPSLSLPSSLPVVLSHPLSLSFSPVLVLLHPLSLTSALTLSAEIASCLRPNLTLSVLVESSKSRIDSTPSVAVARWSSGAVVCVLHHHPSTHTKVLAWASERASDQPRIAAGSGLRFTPTSAAPVGMPSLTIGVRELVSQGGVSINRAGVHWPLRGR